MTFIEQLFGISPDGGNGMFEVLLFVIPMIVLAILSGRYWRSRFR